jgi:uncharacterized protein
VNKTLPRFKYHPNPIATGNVEESSEICICCNQQHGFIYKASIYTPLRFKGSFCPWCISDGSAAEKFEAYFNDPHPLVVNNIPEEIVEEVTKRTPGYVSWQQEVWLTHCKDACEFHGDVSDEEIKKIDDETSDRFCFENELDHKTGKIMIQNYPYSVCIYKFVCRHCETVRYGLDFT